MCILYLGHAMILALSFVKVLLEVKFKMNEEMELVRPKHVSILKNIYSK